MLWLKINSHERESTCSIHSEQLSDSVRLVVFHYVDLPFHRSTVLVPVSDALSRRNLFMVNMEKNGK